MPASAFPAWDVPAREPAPVSDSDLTENSDNLQESLRSLAAKYSLDSITIATADGLVFASSGGDSARADAAYFNRHSAGKDPAGMIIFGLTHGGSKLTGIIHTSAAVSPETRKRIESDTKDILNWWI